MVKKTISNRERQSSRCKRGEGKSCRSLLMCRKTMMILVSVLRIAVLIARFFDRP